MLAGLALCAVIGLFIGAVLFTADSAEMTSYMSDDPKACVNCHIMRQQYNDWQRSSHHAAATCNDCHTPHDFVGKYTMKAVHGYRHSKGFTLGDFPDPIRIKPDSLRVVDANCVRCHEAITSEIGAHAPVPGRKDAQLNPEGLDSLNCIHCHSHAGHGPRN
jgi:cytochrome c nitrite reductase small subunit